MSIKQLQVPEVPDLRSYEHGPTFRATQVKIGHVYSFKPSYYPGKLFRPLERIGTGFIHEVWTPDDGWMKGEGFITVRDLRIYDQEDHDVFVQQVASRHRGRIAREAEQKAQARKNAKMDALKARIEATGLKVRDASLIMTTAVKGQTKTKVIVMSVKATDMERFLKAMESKS
jgi:hypothetical protein